MGPGLELHWIFWVFRKNVLWQDTTEPSLVLVKPRKDMNNVSFCDDMTETLERGVKHHSFNQ